MTHVPIEQTVIAQEGKEHRYKAVADFMGGNPKNSRFWLTSRTGNHIELPPELIGALSDIATALGEKRAVNINKLSSPLTLGTIASLARIRREDVRSYAERLGYEIQQTGFGHGLTLRQALAIVEVAAADQEAGAQEMFSVEEEIGFYQQANNPEKPSR